MAPQRRAAQLGKLAAVNEDRALIDVIEALNERDRCALARAARPDERNDAAGLDAQAQAAQHLGLRPRRIRKVHVAELYSAHERVRDKALVERHHWLAVKQLEDALGCANRRAQ